MLSKKNVLFHKCVYWNASLPDLDSSVKFLRKRDIQQAQICTNNYLRCRVFPLSDHIGKTTIDNDGLVEFSKQHIIPKSYRDCTAEDECDEYYLLQKGSVMNTILHGRYPQPHK